jgi:acid phosphatase (class A)
MNLDDIKYGNHAKEHEDAVKADKAGILKACMDKGIIKDIVENHPFAANSSDETRNELDYLVELTSDIDDEDFKLCYLMEMHHYDFLAVVGRKLGLDVDGKMVKELCSKTNPVLFYLKDVFDRPRPYQLAKELNLPIFPIIRTDANSAAYPSGHSLDFLVTLYHFGKMKPEAAEEIDEFYHEIKRVRELSGVHYPSDRKISEYLFKQLVKHNLIK